MDRLRDDAPELSIPPSPAEIERLLDWMVNKGLLTKRLDLYGSYVYRITEFGKKLHSRVLKWLAQQEEA